MRRGCGAAPRRWRTPSSAPSGDSAATGSTKSGRTLLIGTSRCQCLECPLSASRQPAIWRQSYVHDTQERASCCSSRVEKRSAWHSGKQLILVVHSRFSSWPQRLTWVGLQLITITQARHAACRLVAVAAERLQSSEASLFWSNIVGLLYTAAAAHDTEVQQKVPSALCNRPEAPRGDTPFV